MSEIPPIKKTLISVDGRGVFRKVKSSPAPSCSLSDSDKAFLWSLMPDWVSNSPANLDPTMYGTGSREGDLRVRDRITTILGENEREH